MKKYNKETLKDIKSRNPLVKYGNLNDEVYTWFFVEKNDDGSLIFPSIKYLWGVIPKYFLKLEIT